MKKTPERSCVGCGMRREKKDLLRVVMGDDGMLIPDESGKLPGRGAYLCKDPACVELAEKKRAFYRAFRRGADHPIAEEAYNRLKEQMRGDLG